MKNLVVCKGWLRDARSKDAQRRINILLQSCSLKQISLIFVIYFSDIGQCYRPAQKNGLENQKSVCKRIN